MQELQMSLGAAGGATWLSTVITASVPAVVAAAAALGGVWLTQRGAASQRAAELKAEEQRRKNEASRAQDALDEKRRFATFDLARHMERYAFLCASQITNHTDRWTNKRVAFPKWVLLDNIDWPMVGINLTVRARDFERRRILHDAVRKGTIDVAGGSEIDDDKFTAEALAKIGVEAWNIAVTARKSVDIQEFDFTGTWNYADSLIKFPD